jgi:hypothetical protein
MEDWAMGETGQGTATLPIALRSLRIGLDDELRIRRTVNLAAAKIEALEMTVSHLTAALESANNAARTGDRGAARGRLGAECGSRGR